MKYIEDIRDGDSVVGHYFCKEKQTMKSRAGKMYLSLLVSDRTGVLDAKIWDINENIQPFEAGDFIKLDGFVSSYQGELQMKITRLRKSQEGEYAIVDYIPTTARDTASLYGELVSLIGTVVNPFIKALLMSIFVDDADINERFLASTAAKTYHHNYMGGLLEHTLSVAKLCDFCAKHYEGVNRDLLVAAAMLHDIGKVWELTGFPQNDYTDAGQLLGHIYIGTELIERKTADIPDFPENLALLLKHCVLSHHGDYEFGSPRLPSVTEAFVLYACDNLDAKVFSIMDTINRDKSGGKWTGYNKMLARNIRRTE